MKAQHSLLLAGLSLLALFTACDKSNPELTGDKNDAGVGKYVISDASSAYASIELTNTGEFIVTRNVAKTKADENDYSPEDVWVFGSFNVKDGSYVLNGFGELIIKSLGNGKFTLNIVSDELSDPVVVTATAASTVVKTELDRRLCQHWVFEKTHVGFSYNGGAEIGLDLKAGNFTNWLKINNDEEGVGELGATVEGLLFTETGSLVILYDNERINVGTWNGHINDDGSITSSWETGYASSFKDYRFNGDLNVSFVAGENGEKDRCVIVNNYTSTYRKGLLGFFEKVVSVVVNLTYTLVAA